MGIFIGNVVAEDITFVGLQVPLKVPASSGVSEEVAVAAIAWGLVATIRKSLLVSIRSSNCWMKGSLLHALLLLVTQLPLGLTQMHSWSPHSESGSEYIK